MPTRDEVLPAERSEAPSEPLEFGPRQDLLTARATGLDRFVSRLAPGHWLARSSTRVSAASALSWLSGRV